MSINASWLRIFLEMQKAFGFKGDVLIWGVQDVHMNHAEVAEIMRERGTACIEIPEPERAFMLSKNQQQWTSDPRRFMATKDLFRMMGFTSLQTLDAFPHDNPDILCNLNEPLPTEYQQKFDVVIDIGVIEHTTNGFQALENAGNLLKVGGYFVSLTPLISPIQAAIFHPNPPFYYDILSANGFQNFKSYVQWMPDWDQHTDIRSIWLEYQYNDAVEICRPHYYTSLFVIAQKCSHVGKFRTVLQNYYVTWHNEAGIPKPANFSPSSLRLVGASERGGSGATSSAPVELSLDTSSPAQSSAQAGPANSKASLPPAEPPGVAVKLYRAVVPRSLRAKLYTLRHPTTVEHSPQTLGGSPVTAMLELSPGQWVPYAAKSTVPNPVHGVQPIPERMYVGNPPREQLYL